MGGVEAAIGHRFAGCSRPEKAQKTERRRAEGDHRGDETSLGGIAKSAG